jgi:hypothetical protein
MWPLFVVKSTESAQISLRRYVRAATPCPGNPWRGYHDASVIVGEESYVPYTPIGDTHPHDDPLWPAHCTCGYQFTPEDEWQRVHDHLYIRADDSGDPFTVHQLPIGAVLEVPWMRQRSRRPSPEDLAKGTNLGLLSIHYWRDWAGTREPLLVECPTGNWIIDQTSSNGDGWTVTGTPPLLTARPSILLPGYHGWLTDGVLSDDLEGRTY